MEGRRQARLDPRPKSLHRAYLPGNATTMAENGTILIAAADVDLRDAIGRRFARAGFETSECSRGEEALSSVRNRHPPALVILDLELADMSGYEACAEIREQVGDMLPILLLSEERTESYDRVAGLLIGADDYLARPFDPDELLARARRLLSRGPVLVSTPESTLTARELQVLQLLANGLSQDRIANELFISPKTVGSHIQRTLGKLGVHSRTEAVALAYQQGLVRGSSPEEG
jgi:two-component system nitrate/nitrite response regulator NarL